MKKKRIFQAIEVIEFAIKENITVTDASVKCGHSYTYVKNVKSDLLKGYKNGRVNKELHDYFMVKYDLYEVNQRKIPNPRRIKDNDKTIYVIPDDTNKTISEVPKDLPKQPVKTQLKQTTKGNSSEILFSANDSMVQPFVDLEQEKIEREEREEEERERREQLNDEEREREDEDREHQEGRGYASNHIKTIDDLLDACSVDQEVWQVKDYLVNKWDVTSWRRGYAQTVENFQVKARLERQPELHKAQMAAKIFQKMTKNYTPPQLGQLPDMRLTNDLKRLENEFNMLEVSIFDLHLGKLGWAGETGENFDTKIASKRFIDSVKTLIYRAQGFNITKILFPVGQDFFNSDNKENTTSNGTPQDEDLRWQKTFDVGCRLLVDATNLLKQMGVDIEIMVIPGNHDFERSFYVGKYLEGWFNSDPQVHVNNGASPRKYKVHGKVLLGFTHGKDEKQDSLPLLMATDKESKPFWSTTVYHEWHLGHIHRQKTFKYTVLDKNKIVDEDLGVTVRYLSSLTGTEEWHHKKGYVGQIKGADAFVWNDQTGLVAHLKTNLLEE